MGFELTGRRNTAYIEGTWNRSNYFPLQSDFEACRRSHNERLFQLLFSGLHDPLCCILVQFNISLRHLPVNLETSAWSRL